jgi:hypothetical protein
VFDWSGAFGILGTLSISAALVVLAQLSRRLGRVTGATSYYVGFYLAALLVAVGAAARLLNLGDRVAAAENLHQNVLWVLLYNGAPAAGLTVGVIIAWYYWSWLLAERD